MATRGRREWDSGGARSWQFEHEARQRGLPFARRFVGRPRRLSYLVDIDVDVYDDQRRLQITMPTLEDDDVYPRVRIDGPTCTRHRFKDGHLCMWWSEDEPDRRWHVKDGLYAVVQYAAEHAYCEAECRAGKPWPKPEAPGQHTREGCPTCQPPS